MFLLSVIVMGCSGSGPSKGVTPPVVISISGSEGMTVTGTYGDQLGQEEVKNQAVPVEFKIENPRGTVNVNVHKDLEAGQIVASVTHDGKELAKGESSAPFGMVNLSAPLD